MREADNNSLSIFLLFKESIAKRDKVGHGDGRRKKSKTGTSVS